MPRTRFGPVSLWALLAATDPCQNVVYSVTCADIPRGSCIPIPTVYFLRFYAIRRNGISRTVAFIEYICGRFRPWTVSLEAIGSTNCCDGAPLCLRQGKSSNNSSRSGWKGRECQNFDIEKLHTQTARPGKTTWRPYHPQTQSHLTSDEIAVKCLSIILYIKINCCSLVSLKLENG